MSWMRGLSPIVSNCLTALFLSYLVLFQFHNNTLLILWRTYIFLYSGYYCKCAKILDLSPIVRTFHVCGKIRRQKNRQINKHFTLGLRNVYFSFVERILFGDVRKFIPNSSQFSCVRKKKADRQTDK